MKKWLKAELHAHTREDPWDGARIAHSARRLIEEASRQGFEVLAITNHDQMLFTSRLQEFARERGILLIPGVEATLQGKHVLLYNFREYQPSWRDFGTVARKKGPGQLVVAPHPFFPSPTALGQRLLEQAHLFDGIEYSHFYLSWLNFNRQAERVGERLDLPLIGTSDAHHLFQLGQSFTLVHAEAEPSSVITAIKEGKTRLVTRPMSSLFLARWLLMALRWMGKRHIERLSGWPKGAYRPAVAYLGTGPGSTNRAPTN